jgi:hypothetical protein
MRLPRIRMSRLQGTETRPHRPGKPIVEGGGLWKERAALRHVQEQLGEEEGLAGRNTPFRWKRVRRAWASSSWRAIF